MNETLRCLSEAGVATWLDSLSRSALRRGRLAELVQVHGVSGLAGDVSAVPKELGSGAYDVALAAAISQETGVDEALQAIMAADAREAADVLRPVFEATDGVDGWVTVGLDASLCCDTVATVAAARRMGLLVGRPNLLVAVPGTTEGLAAISDLVGSGVGVHASVIVSVERFLAVIEAYRVGLEGAVANGLDISTCGAVASVSLSPLDTEVDKRLWAIGSDEAAALRGCAAVANARLVHAAHHRAFAGHRWKGLLELGARPLRLAWTLTEVRDPYYVSALYVEELVADGVVSIVSEATLGDLAEQRKVMRETARDYDHATEVVAALKAVGVELDDAIRAVETAAIGRHATMWGALREAMESWLSAASC